MILPKTKLKHQLVLLNTFLKLLIIVLLGFTLPWMVNKVAINDTDRDLIKKLDDVLYLVDSMGINSFIDADAEFQAFGSYNILKEEYISIENMDSDTLINHISYMERIIEDELVNYRVLSYSFEKEGAVYLIEIGKSISTILAFQKQLKRFAMLFMILILVLTIMFEVSVIQYMLRPIDQIVQKLKKSTHPSRFDYTPLHTNTSDFSYLEQTIHQLMHQIADTFNNEREYISNVSHELLTPISIIKSKLDAIIMEGKLPEEDMLRIFESKQTLGRLTSMIRTLLTLSRIENQEYLLHDQVDVMDVMRNVAAELEDRLLDKKLELKTDFAVENFYFKGNRDLLFTMCYNLVNNALKYTESGHILLAAKFDKQDFRLTVADTGRGIEPENLPHIFSRFRKFKTGTDSFGLGLALAKKIADYHRISIQVESEPGAGTRFFLDLPLD